MQTAEQQPEKLNFDKVWLMFQETRDILDKKFQETDKQFKATDKQFKATDKKLRDLEKLFTGHWGRLMESLVEGDLIHLLNERKIPVNLLYTRVRGIHDGRQFEFDIIAENGDEIVVVEVKTTLKTDDVKDFIKDLKSFKTMRPKYRDNKVIGAVAYLTDEGNASRMAQKKGLFVIRATGNSANIINHHDFQPKSW